MEYKFTIPGRLDGLNEYTSANRSNAYRGGRMKQKNEKNIIHQIRRQLLGISTITAPVLTREQAKMPMKDLLRDLETG